MTTKYDCSGVNSCSIITQLTHFYPVSFPHFFFHLSLPFQEAEAFAAVITARIPVHTLTMASGKKCLEIVALWLINDLLLMIINIINLRRTRLHYNLLCDHFEKPKAACEDRKGRKHFICMNFHILFQELQNLCTGAA